MPARMHNPARSARRKPRAEADVIAQVASAGRRVSVQGRLLRKEARQFALGLRRMSWLLPIGVILLLTTWATLLVGLYRTVAHYSGHDGLGLAVVLALQVSLLWWLQRDASAATRRMGFPHTRRRLREAAALWSWLTSMGRREHVR